MVIMRSYGKRALRRHALHFEDDRLRFEFADPDRQVAVTLHFAQEQDAVLRDEVDPDAIDDRFNHGCTVPAASWLRRARAPSASGVRNPSGFSCHALILHTNAVRPKMNAVPVGVNHRLLREIRVAVMRHSANVFERPIGDDGLSDDVVDRDRAEDAGVGAVLAVIAEHEDEPSGTTTGGIGLPWSSAIGNACADIWLVQFDVIDVDVAVPE